MRRLVYCAVAAAVLRINATLASTFETALDLIVKHHGDNVNGLSHTLESLKLIATRLNDEPHNFKYRRIRLLNKKFWERIGRVDGGIPFMTALGFDLVDQDGEPAFHTRKGAPLKCDLNQALELLSVRGASTWSAMDRESAGGDDVEVDKFRTPSVEVGTSGFNPFATAFSRKSRTRVQERAEEGLANLAEQHAKLQLRFSRIEDRNVTILLPRLTSRGVTKDAEHDIIGDSDGGDLERRALGLVAQVWQERISRDNVRRFETRRVKDLRLLRASKVYPYVLVRVRLPSGVYIQARFNAEETLEDVYHVLEKILEEEAGVGISDERSCVRFELFVAPATRALPRDSTRLKDANVLAPACMLHLRWETEQPEAELWVQLLEASTARITESSLCTRLPYAARYDVPEAFSAKRKNNK